METPLLILDIWKQIWSQVSLRAKGRLELTCQAFRQQIWQDSDNFNLIHENPFKAARRLAIYGAKPAVARRVRALVIDHDSVPVQTPWRSFLSNATNLKQLSISDNCEETSLLTLLCRAQPPALKSLALRGQGDGKEYYAKIDGRLFWQLTSLETLSLHTQDQQPAPLTLLEALAASFGSTLTALSLQIAYFDRDCPISNMAALKRLKLDNCRLSDSLSDLSDLPQLLTWHKEVLPPNVGVNFLSEEGSICRSILFSAIKQEELAILQELIEKHHADPNLSASDFGEPWPEFPLQEAIENENYKAAKLLISLGAKTVGYGEQTAFGATLLSWKGDGDEWWKFASWLFDEYWPTVVHTSSPTKLLGFDPEQIFFHFMHSVSSANLKRRTKFVLERPHIFGLRSFHEIDANGCNLAHHCEVFVDLDFVKAMEIDWHHRDNAGRTAIECLAFRDKDMTTDALLSWCESDEDFLAHCTPDVWRSLHGDKLATVYGRMIGLIPDDPGRWQELITACLQLAIRHGRLPSVWQPLFNVASDPGTQNNLWQAVFTPFSQVSKAPWFVSAKLDRRLPVPCYIGQSHFLAEQLVRHFPTRDAAKAWLEERDKFGRTAEENVCFYATSSEDMALELSALDKALLPGELWTSHLPAVSK